MQTLLQNTPRAETVQTLSMALIIFGTLAAALAVLAVRRDGTGLLTRMTEFFFGDLRTKNAPVAAPVPSSGRTVEQPDQTKTSRREIDNFDLSIFEDF